MDYMPRVMKEREKTLREMPPKKMYLPGIALQEMVRSSEHDFVFRHDSWLLLKPMLDVTIN